MREFSVPAVTTVDDNANLTDPVWDNAESHPKLTAFRRRVDARWQDVTTVEFRDQVLAVAKGLVAAGVQTGERVGLMAKTRYEWTVVDYAIWAAGAVTVPVYETSSAEQVAWVLGDSGAVACVAGGAEHEAVVESVRGDLPQLKHVWQLDADAVGTLTGLGSTVADEEIDRRRSAVGAEDLATIIYTSGTTGRPKGCELTHRNMLFDVGNSVPGLSELFTEGKSTLLFLPLAHSFARLIQCGSVQSRVTMGHTADVKNLLPDLAEFQPSFVLSVPRVFEKVYNSAKQKAHADGKGAIFDRADRTAVAYSEALDKGGPGPVLRVQHALFERLVYGRIRGALGGRCEAAISGGAPLGARLGHFFRGIGVTVYEGYGLTETSPASTSNNTASLRVGTVGKPLPGVTVRIDDDGEILIRGDHVFRGYWKNPDATAEVLDSDRWFHTGDLGELDEEGYLRITGRKKEILVTAGGKNVAPAVLEDRVRAHALVSQCMVVGDQRPFIGAVITVDPEAFPAWKERAGKPAEASVADLRDDTDLRAEIGAAVEDANKAVSKAEAIKKFRILPNDFTETGGELTPSLKLKRSVVMKEYAEDIAAIYG